MLDFQTPRVAQEWPESSVSKVLKLRLTTTEIASRPPGLKGLKLKESGSKMIMHNAYIFEHLKNLKLYNAHKFLYLKSIKNSVNSHHK